jgi:tetratricopeptide (TPR) repeat protein
MELLDDFFSDLLIRDSKISRDMKAILFHLRNGPMRAQTLHKVIPGSNIKSLRIQLNSLVKKDILLKTAFKTKNNPFFRINRIWVIKKFSQYRMKIGTSHESSIRQVNAFIQILGPLVSDPLKWEEEKHPGSISNYSVPKDSLILEKNKKNLKEYKRENDFTDEGRKIGDSISSQVGVVGIRTEIGETLLENGSRLVEFIENNNSVSEFLRKLWGDIYSTDAKPASGDIEKDLLRDYQKNVKSSPDMEKRTRIMLWMADIFHILDMYELSLKYFRSAQGEAKDKKLDFNSILSGFMISGGHLKVHNNDLQGGAEEFLLTIEDPNTPEVLKARSLFRIAEVEINLGDTVLAEKFLLQCLSLCREIAEKGGTESVLQIESDAHRRLGTVYRMDNNLEKAYEQYLASEEICKDRFRGWVWLQHGWAEYYRSLGYSTMTRNSSGEKTRNNDSDRYFELARNYCQSAKMMSAKIRNINRYAHALLIECEINRTQYGTDLDTITLTDMKRKYAQVFDIYLNIKSNWGLVNLFLSQYLAFLHTPGEMKEYHDLLPDAEDLCREMKLTRELAVVQKILTHTCDGFELNQLALF